MTPEDIAKLVADTVRKELADAGIFEKMTKEHQAYHDNLDGDEQKQFQSMRHDERKGYMAKHPISGDTDRAEGDEPEATGGHEGGAERDDTPPPHSHAAPGRTKKADDGVTKMDDQITKALREQNADLQKRLKALEEDKAQAEFAKRAVKMGMTEKDGVMLLKANRGDPEALKWMEETISKLHVQVQKAGLFSEIGATGDSNGATAYDRIVAKASEFRKISGNERLTTQQAFDKVYTDPENAELAAQERAERYKANNLG